MTCAGGCLCNNRVYEGLVVDGKKSGRWVVRLADGVTAEVCYRADEILAMGDTVDCNASLGERRDGELVVD